MGGKLKIYQKIIFFSSIGAVNLKRQRAAKTDPNVIYLQENLLIDAMPFQALELIFMSMKLNVKRIWKHSLIALTLFLVSNIIWY